MLWFIFFRHYLLYIILPIRACRIAPYVANMDALWKLKIIETVEEINSASVELCCCKGKENLQTNWPVQQVL
jgi:hypothetical protein